MNRSQKTLLLIFFSLLHVVVLPLTAFAQSSRTEPKYHYKIVISDIAPTEQRKYQIRLLHPYSFDLKVIQQSMSLLAYQYKKISWSEKKRVFGPQMVRELGPQIQKKFSMVSDQQVVGFAVANHDGKIKLEGDVFLTPEGLHWRVTNLNNSGRGFMENSIMGESWRLVPLEGQIYKSTEPFKGLIQNVTNWIVVGGVKPEKSRILPEPARETTQEKEQGIKARLKVLEELKKEGLIDTDEYKRKRQEILGEL